MSVKVEIGENIRGIRKGQNLSQEALADKLGMSPCYLGGIERGQNNPTIDKLIAVAHALDTSLNSIVFTKSCEMVNTVESSISGCTSKCIAKCPLWQKSQEEHET